MADVVSKTNPQAGVLYSVNTPDYPAQDWFINPTLPPPPSKYWKNDGGVLAEMTQPEKDAVDQAEADALAVEERKKYHSVESAAESQTTSTTFQTKLSLATENLPLGVYEVSARWKVRGSVIATAFETRVTQDGLSLFVQNNSATSGDTLGSYDRVIPNLSGVHTYIVEWRRASGLGEVRIYDAVLSIRKVVL